MDYFCFIQSTVSYIENRLKTEVESVNLEHVTGFSMAHIRDVFRACTNMPLARYIVYRKVSNAAFEMVHTEKNILDIALDYGFESHDTFTRAFKRVTGVTPREFRRGDFQVGRQKLSAGVFGPGLIKSNRMIDRPRMNWEETIRMKTMDKSQDSCILYGVPKVEYTGGECTPFPSALKAVLNYMGQEISYAYLMGASGAAFRLRWNTTCWDGGNVGIAFIYEDMNEAYKRSFAAAGRAYRILERNESTKKQEFIDFFKAEIDSGRPVIALGIIGPPEACIITGYRDNGNTLLGWNFFQENPEFAKGVEIDESGYFISTAWWENPDTIALMSIGEEKQANGDLKEILANALDILTREKIGDRAGGPAAFDAWVNAMTDESQFPKGALLPLLFERLMCQGDAVDMIMEGRHYASVFMEWAATQNDSIHAKCLEAAKLFKEESQVPHKMNVLLGGWQRGEEQARAIAKPEVRKGIAEQILEAKKLELRARACLQDILKSL